MTSKMLTAFSQLEEVVVVEVPLVEEELLAEVVDFREEAAVEVSYRNSTVSM